MRNRPRHHIILFEIGRQQKHRSRTKGISGQVHHLHPDIVVVDLDGELDIGLLEEVINLFALLHGHLTVVTTRLVVIAVCPENTDTDQILLQVIGTAHVRSGKETETAGIDFEGLINRKFRAEIGNALLILRINLVGMFIGFR